MTVLVLGGTAEARELAMDIYLLRRQSGSS